MATLNRLPITKARINLGQIARRAHNGNEYFILEKDGIPVIGIMAADELEDYLELRNPKVKVSIAASGKDRAAGKHWEDWVKAWNERKAAGEKNIALHPDKLE